MFENFPYTDIHQLNLDWIANVAKNFLDQYTSLQQMIADGETSLDNKTAAGLQQLQDKADALELALNAWYTEHSEDIAGELTAAVASFQESAQAIGADVIASIPEDYTALTNEVDDIEDTILFINREMNALDLSGIGTVSAIITANNTYRRSAGHYKSYQIQRLDKWSYIKITAQTTHPAYMTFVTEALPSLPTNGDPMDSILSTGEIGRHIIAANTSEVFAIPTDCEYIIITNISNDTDLTPSAIAVSCFISGDVYNLKNEIQTKLDKTYPVNIDWSLFADSDNPLGWQTGYYSKISGATGTSSDYMRTVAGKYYEATAEDTEISFSVPSSVASLHRAQVTEFDNTGTFVRNIGNYDDGTYTVKFTPVTGYKYAFTIGGFSGDAASNINETFLAGVVAVVRKSFMYWKNQTDSRLDSLENVVDTDIPEYYFANDYLQDKLNDITGIQNTMNPDNFAFWFVTDYHQRNNQKNSIPLLKYLSARTGIESIMFGGDSGGSQGSSESAVYKQIQESANAWNELETGANEMFGIIGNHEWINTTYSTMAGMFGAYLNRYKNTVVMDPDTGSYYLDNPANKVRFFFLQDSSNSSPVSGTLSWFYDRLMELENGWSVVTFVHFAWISQTFQAAEYDGYSFDYNYTSIKGVSILLSGCRDNSSVTVGETTYDFTSKTAVNSIIGIFSGHMHHGILFPADDQYNTLGIMTFAGGTDSLHGGVAGMTYEETAGGRPWYWLNGVQDGTKVPRDAGTVNEQCFYAVQVDLTAKKVYITAIGGDNDYETVYES